MTATLRIATAYSVKLPVNCVAFPTSARLSSDADTNVRNIAIRVSTSLCVVERDASRLQCSVARIWMRRAVSDGAASVRGPTASAAGRVIVPCGHHAPGAQLGTASMRKDGRMRTLPFAAAFAVPALVLGLAACAPADAPETPDTAGTDTPDGLRAQRPDVRGGGGERGLRHRSRP